MNNNKFESNPDPEKIQVDPEKIETARKTVSFYEAKKRLDELLNREIKDEKDLESVKSEIKKLGDPLGIEEKKEEIVTSWEDFYKKVEEIVENI